MYILLQGITWVEVKEAFEKAKMAIIPLEATSKHGSHLPDE
ncbi:MAG: hypothetical protein ACE5OW_02405 [Candidatus Bathyarchaeia archaeon]